jgi:hypothetical protein
MASPDNYQQLTVFRQSKTRANIVSIPKILGELLNSNSKRHRNVR